MLPENIRWKYRAEWRTRQGMIQRCENSRSRAYRYYGALGVTVCEDWKRSFVWFLRDMGPRPGPGYSIDRINPFGNYEPGNCRWATAKQQARNKRRHAKPPRQLAPEPRKRLRLCDQDVYFPSSLSVVAALTEHAVWSLTNQATGVL